MDRIDRQRRSWNMSRIKSKDTRPEKQVRSALHAMGYRFRLHRSKLPGRPDIVLPKYRTVVFVHGCFWHRHRGCKFAYMPKSRVGFWKKKFDENVVRDRTVTRLLRRSGWAVITIWECEVADLSRVAQRLALAMPRKAETPRHHKVGGSI